MTLAYVRYDQQLHRDAILRIYGKALRLGEPLTDKLDIVEARRRVAGNPYAYGIHTLRYEKECIMFSSNVLLSEKRADVSIRSVISDWQVVGFMIYKTVGTDTADLGFIYRDMASTIKGVGTFFSSKSY